MLFVAGVGVLGRLELLDDSLQNLLEVGQALVALAGLRCARVDAAGGDDGGSGGRDAGDSQAVVEDEAAGDPSADGASLQRTQV